MCDQKKDHADDVDDLSASDESEPEEQPFGAPFDPELDHDDDDDIQETEFCAPAVQTPFSLRGGNSAFSNRSHSIFDCLDSVAQKSSSSRSQEPSTDGEFVRPQPPQSSRKTSHPPSASPTPPKKRGVPDYLVHPERWTRYSLEDVAETSDQDNRRAAHQFLSSLQQEKPSESSCDAQQRMIFSRPKRPLKEHTTDQLSAVTGKEKGMHLSHLEDVEEEGHGEKKKARRGGSDQSEEETEEHEKDEERERSEAVDSLEMENKKADEQKVEDVNIGFASFRKIKSKNYRKGSQQDN